MAHADVRYEWAEPRQSQMIPGGPGHLSRDSGTKRSDGEGAGLGLLERPAQARPVGWGPNPVHHCF